MATTTVNLGKVKGSQWYTGTAITGTATAGTVFAGSGISTAVPGDLYLNISTSNVYACTLGGVASAAKWAYVGSIKGAKGDSVKGDPGPSGKGLPTGGAVGSIPTKNSATDYDTKWTPILPVASGGTGVTTDAAIGLKAYPVGSVYLTYGTENPAQKFGGTWSLETETYLYLTIKLWRRVA